MKKVWFVLLLLAASLLGCSPITPAHAADGGQVTVAPPSLVISYHVPPVNRAAFRALLQQGELRQFQAWKEQGVLKNFRMLFSCYADSDNWDALAVLDFANSTDVSRWQAIERSRPAGLSPSALALTSAIHSTTMDMPRGAGASGPAGRPWSTLILLEYKDEEALTNRSAVVAKVRAKLSGNPEWKAISDGKAKVREEKQVVIAQQLQSD